MSNRLEREVRDAEINFETARMQAAAALWSLPKEHIVMYMLAACHNNQPHRVGLVLDTFGMQPEFARAAELAAREGYWRVVDLFAAVSADALPAIERGAAVYLTSACRSNDEEKVTEVLNRFGLREDFASAASVAAKLGLCGLLDQFLERGLEVRPYPRGEKRHESLLASAAKGGRVRAVRWLLDRADEDGHDMGALLNEAEYWMPLHGACYASSPDCARMLLEAGADPNASANEDMDCKRPLHIAADVGSVEVIELLLQAGADPSLGTIDPLDTALHHAAGGRDSLLAVRLLAERWPAAVMQKDSQGNTPLAIACRTGRASHVEELANLERLAATTASDFRGQKMRTARQATRKASRRAR